MSLDTPAAQPPLPLLLIVDDEKKLLDLMSLAFSGRFEVRAAASAEDALAIADTTAPGLVLTDLRLQGMDGIQLIRSLRARHPDLPCILFSGNLDRNAWADAHNAGCRHVFSKPISLKSVIEICGRLAATPEVNPARPAAVAPTDWSTWGGGLGAALATVVERCLGQTPTVLLRTRDSTLPLTWLQCLLPRLIRCDGAALPGTGVPAATQLDELSPFAQGAIAAALAGRREAPWLFLTRSEPDELLEAGKLCEALYFRLSTDVIDLPGPVAFPGDTLQWSRLVLSRRPRPVVLSAGAGEWLSSRLDAWTWETLALLLDEAARGCTGANLQALDLQAAAHTMRHGPALQHVKRYPEYAEQQIRVIAEAWDLLGRASP